ncbi:Z394 [Hepatospora eriocheir]|uniref:Z394 n=1 Tax=Hepatospora eriocheir TaxID=1081669 RepID=A0A1X0Q7G2_9MICR|nr:Z394 [Hepatospora eriocheir]
MTRSIENLVAYTQVLHELKMNLESTKRDYNERRTDLSLIDKTIYENLFTLAEETIDKYSKKNSLFGNSINESTTQMNNDGYDYNQDNSNVKRHYCTKPGCTKSYTSNHGLKYHIVHGHRKENEKVAKPFACPIDNCEKTYRNSNGLKYHLTKVHPDYYKN